MLAVEMAQITPPVGFNLFVIQCLTEDGLGYIARVTLPYLVIMIAFVLLLTLWPATVTILPKTDKPTSSKKFGRSIAKTVSAAAVLSCPASNRLQRAFRVCTFFDPSYTVTASRSTTATTPVNVAPRRDAPSEGTSVDDSVRWRTIDAH
ncbi:hypothetical protein XI05_16910 [Bradyrhizobium sp. CCBAU 11357]|nr:hypothetical protein [Bradyrhizobium sp. CCBAU 11357]